jgi:hypothetical protein
MGIIADSFKAKLEAIKQADEESQRQTKETLARIHQLIDTLERIDFED